MKSQSHALIQGASRGIGLELVRQLLSRGRQVVATCRNPERATALQELAEESSSLLLVSLDLEDESSIESAAKEVEKRVEGLDLLFNVAGLLHDGDELQPEKRLEQIEPANLARSFAVNATGPLLVAKHFWRLLKSEERAVLANMSARVGSIEDNGLGGWYAYRASKAAQNMFSRTLSIELGRRASNIIVLSLHPGTVDTDLSDPFQGNVPDHQLFSVERAAGQLLSIINGANEEDSGTFIAWDGQRIPW